MLQFSMPVSLAIYIIVLIICTSAATLYISHAIHKTGLIYKVISVLTSSFMLYTVFEMFTTIFDSFYISRNVYYSFVVASDISFFIIVASWVSMIIIMSGNPFVVPMKSVIIYTLLYGILIEILACVYRYITNVNLSVLANIMMAINLTFDISIIFIGIRLLLYARRDMKEERQQKWVAVLSIILCIYMAYISWWDVLALLDNLDDYTRFKDFDPVHFIYVLICILVVWLIYKKSDIRIGYYISETIGITDDTVEDWEAVANKFKLTIREVELTQLVCKGLSNPEIAEKLFITDNTVKHHLNKIYKKVGVKSRFELINKIKIKGR